MFSMHNDVWRSLFEEIVTPIIDHCVKILATPQMKDAKYIFLVGGFANSKYFQGKMRYEFGNAIHIPDHPGL